MIVPTEAIECSPAVRRETTSVCEIDARLAEVEASLSVVRVPASRAGIANGGVVAQTGEERFVTIGAVNLREPLFAFRRLGGCKHQLVMPLCPSAAAWA